MAQPDRYERQHDFTLDEEGAVSTAALNIEYDNISITVNQIRDNLALIQADDGSLMPGIVGFDQLDPEVMEEINRVVQDGVDKANTAAQKAQDAADIALDCKGSALEALETIKRLEESTRTNAEMVTEYAKDVAELIQVAEPALDALDSFKIVADHVDEVVDVADGIEDVGLVAGDLEGALCTKNSLVSYGNIGEEIDEGYCIKGGNIVKVAEHIEDVHILAPKVEVIEEALEEYTKIESTLTSIKENRAASESAMAAAETAQLGAEEAQRNAVTAQGASEEAAELSKAWAVKMDGMVEGEDYSSKYYASQAQKSAEDALAAGQASVEQISQAAQSAVNAVEQATQDGVTAIEEAASDATNAIDAAEKEAIQAVADTGTAQVTVVQEAGSSQVTLVKQEASTQIQNVQSAGTTQINAVNEAGAEQVSNIEAQANAAADSAAAAAESATAAAGSATNAASSATAAANSASSANTAKTAAESAKTAAEAAKTAAEAAKVAAEEAAQEVDEYTSDAVLYSAQTLTSTEQTQARTNINALGKSENAASASKLATKRTIKLTGGATASLQFDGSGDASATITLTAMKGATSSAAGALGAVPAPASGAQSKYLRGDGTWQTPPNTTYSNMSAATSSAAGKAGLVPAPAAGAQGKFLRGDATWQDPTSACVKTSGTQTVGGTKTFSSQILSSLDASSWVNAANGKTLINSTLVNGDFVPLWQYETTDGDSFVIAGYKTTLSINLVTSENKAAGENTSTGIFQIDPSGNLTITGNIKAKNLGSLASKSSVGYNEMADVVSYGSIA